MKRHLILVGLPGSGKSTVGHLVAQLLPTDFTDLDDEVVREAGRSIAELFARAGEAAFRRLERAAMERALAGPPRVIAAGAGWIAQPGNFEMAVSRRACVVYLRISADLAAVRLSDDESRPLLAGGDRAARLHALLEERQIWYQMAEAEVDAALTPAAVAEAVAALARGV